jgi:ATP-dependent Clp protease ATP-binding subunit ClpX
MGITREGKHCSFCGTPGGPGTDVTLLGGLGAQICASCVDDFHAGLRDEERLASAKTMPWDSMGDAEVLATLPRILASAEQNADFAQEWVDMLRERGVSWAEIGRTLGVSRQAVWARFSKKQAIDGVIA